MGEAVLCIRGAGYDYCLLHSLRTVSRSQDPSLPEGWEQRQANDGRVYYVDHNTHSTSWDHPTELAQGGSKPGEGLGALPGGWQMKQMADGRLFFVDHSEWKGRSQVTS